MKSSRGFTLIEMMITVVIIAILAAIAIPSYQRYVWKARRSDATNTLQRLAALEEQVYFRNNAYTTDAGLLVGSAATSTSTLSSDGGYYTITLAWGSSTDNQSFSLSAAPVAGKSQVNDTQCQNFSLDNTNKRAATNASICWPN